MIDFKALLEMAKLLVNLYIYKIKQFFKPTKDSQNEG
jgi:hypothetical protein